MNKYKSSLFTRVNIVLARKVQRSIEDRCGVGYSTNFVFGTHKERLELITCLVDRDKYSRCELFANAFNRAIESGVITNSRIVSSYYRNGAY